MRKLILFLPLLLALNSRLNACLNENRVLLNGKINMTDGPSLVPYGRYIDDMSELQDELNESDSLWKANKRIEDYSDYGVVLVYMKRFEEAKRIFIEIERTHPGLYATAANLGTTYELLGNNDSALVWIKRAIQINPESHQHSEWLHVKILEAKIKGEQFITTKFFLNTAFGEDIAPKSTLDSLSLVKLRDAIYYQLCERVTFIKPKDKIIALLTFELGNICAITDDVTSSLRIYDRAKEYGYNSPVLEERYAAFLKLQRTVDNEYTRERRGYNYLYYIGACAAIAIFIVLLRRKRQT